MTTIEVRIQATNTFPHRGEHDESASYYLDLAEPVSAVTILNALQENNALKHYISDSTIPANLKENQQLASSLNEQGEFVISLPSTVTGTQHFIIRILG